MVRYIAIAVSLLSSNTPVLAAQRNCLTVIQEWNEAVDFQEVGDINDFTWEDGYTRWPGREKTKWSEVHVSGPPKYDTTLRGIRISPIKGNRQSVLLKAITRRVDINPDTGAFDFYTGDYTVAKVNYTCERRNGEWKIFSQVVTHREDLRNDAAAKRYQKLKKS